MYGREFYVKKKKYVITYRADLKFKIASKRAIFYIYIESLKNSYFYNFVINFILARFINNHNFLIISRN